MEIEANPDDILSIERDGRDLLVLDSKESAILRVDRQGKVLQRIGRKGQGPGDLSFRQAVIGSPQKLKRLPNGSIGVVDGKRGNVFGADGKLVGLFPVDTFAPGMEADVQIAPWGPSSFLVSQSNRWHFELSSPARTELYLKRAMPTGSGRFRVTTLGMLHNPLVITDPVRALSGAYPYRWIHRRIWGASDSTIAVLPYSFFGVCHFSEGGRLLRTTRVMTAPRPTDRSEQTRVITADLGKPDAPNPFLKMTGRQYFAGAWPPHAPFYYDLLVSSTGSFAAVRLAPGGLTILDAFTADGRLAASYALPSTLRLHQLAGDTLIGMDRETGEVMGRLVLGLASRSRQ